MSELNGSAAAGLVRDTDIVHEMQGAYLDYAMSVIVSRALPDVRDGLKPVHRRILYAMHHDLGLDHTKPHKKSARIVGEVLGKYHPHGDVAVYDAMVRMAQTFSLRYPLVDGQGNFGSVDGDGAAAMRYTEARLAELSQFMLADLEKATVDWHDNFDNTLSEPDVLPATLPNLLINGASGIAVGMATNVPPHNLGEVVDALAFMLDHYDRIETITVDHLMQFIHGPDFPTGGILYRYRDEKNDENLDVVAQGYSVGRSRLVMQAKAHFEEMSRGRSRIVVTELPYQTNKVALLERIAGLVRDSKLEGIADLRDESDRTGMRVVVELTRSADPKRVLADLFKYTPLQQTFGMQMLALVDGEPRTLSLKRMLHLFIQHRQEVIRRRSEHDLERAKQRAHILEGLVRALDVLDDVIDTIRRSQNAETARNNLMRDFKFTQVQAQAILDMQLRRLAALERRRLQEEYKEVQKQIAYLEDLLANPQKVLGVIKDDLLHLKEKYGDARRTQIVDRTKGTLTSTDLLPEQEVWVTVGRNGEVRRQDTTNLTGATLRQIGRHSEVGLLTANTRDYLYLFAGDGRCRRMAIHELPYGAQPKHVAELTDYTRRDEMTAAIALPRVTSGAAQGYLFLITEQGIVKRITLADFLGATAGDPTVMNVEGKDRLRWVLHTPAGDEEIILVSSAGLSIRFPADSVRSMGLAAGGVGGMKLKKGERIVYAAVVEPEGELITMTGNGFAKRTELTQYSPQGRNGSGIVTHKINGRTGPISAALLLGPEAPENVIVLTQKGAPQTIELDAIPRMGRNVQGKQVVNVDADNAVTMLRGVRPPLAVAVEAATPPVVDLPPASMTPAPAANGDGTAANGSTHDGAAHNGQESPSDETAAHHPNEKQPDTTSDSAGKPKRSQTQSASAKKTRRQSETVETAPDNTEPTGTDTAPGKSPNDGPAPTAGSRATGKRTSRRAQTGSDKASDNEPDKKSGAQKAAKENDDVDAPSASTSRRNPKRRSGGVADGGDDAPGAAKSQSGKRRRRQEQDEAADLATDAAAETPKANAPPADTAQTPQSQPTSEEQPASPKGKRKQNRKLETVTTVRKPKRKK